MNNQLLSIKAKKFGVRLAGFRQKKGISTEALSMWTGITKEELGKIECGESAISLPLIELIALKLGLMTETLINGKLDNNGDLSTGEQFNQQYSALRDRMIALTLRKTRTEQNKTVTEVASHCDIDEIEIEQYELGSEPIPWPVLERLCEEYQLPITSLVTSLSTNEEQPRQNSTPANDSTHIPTELIGFIQNPVNLPYLELAKRLSEFDAAKLRSIAEGLLEITH